MPTKKRLTNEELARMSPKAQWALLKIEQLLKTTIRHLQLEDMPEDLPAFLDEVRFMSAAFRSAAGRMKYDRN